MLSAVQAKRLVGFFRATPPQKQQKIRKVLQEIQWANRDGRAYTGVGGYVAKILKESFAGELEGIKAPLCFYVNLPSHLVKTSYFYYHDWKKFTLPIKA